VRVLTTIDLLELWERGLAQLPVRRAVDVLERALPERGESIEALPVGTRDRLLLDIRERTFGSRMNAVTDCTACAARIEMEFETREIRAAEVADAGPVEVLSNGYELRLRLPDSRDIMAAATLDDEAAGITELFRRCLLEAHKGEDAVEARALPGEIMDVAAEAMSQADPQADTRLVVECPACGAANRPPLDIGAYLWREIEMAALRALREVHELAEAYGWEERRILRMSPVRRRCYLEMVRA
jgi:hypothetical protein